MKKTTVIIKKRDLKRIKRIRICKLCAFLLMALLSVTVVRTVFTSAASDDIGRVKYYTNVEIGEGDSLWSIADRYVTDEYADRDAYIRELCAINQISADEAIHTGAFLVVPYYADEK